MMMEQQGRAEGALKPATAVEELRIGMRRASRSTPVRMKCALLFLPLLGLTPSCLIIDSTVRRPDQVRGLPAQVAFGSCGHQAKPQPILDMVVAQDPDLFIYLGDNIYGDTESMTLLASKYQQLGAKPGFQALRRTSAVVATWDDHDYGSNDAGKEYPKKEESKEIFLDFWAEHSLSERRRRPGIYTHYDFEEKGRRMQVILLDSRTFRDPLRATAGNPGFKNDYRPDPNPEKTLLGEAQWTWLEERFREPADLRIIASSIQFSHEYNGWESWTNLPAQQQKMIDLIASTRANGVVFISGDVHWGEISRRPTGLTYPIYDVTSSGLTETWPTLEPNRYRQGKACRKANFGLIQIDWGLPDPTVTMQIRGVDGSPQAEKVVRMSELEFPPVTVPGSN